MDKPWLHEPNRKEWTAYGFRCLILRSDVTGALCGYVGVPPGHLLFGIVDVDLDVHGGITFARKGRKGWPWAPSLWWFGFDTAHAGDFAPTLVAFLESVGCDTSHHYQTETYRHLAYVELETEYLARQLSLIPFGEFGSNNARRRAGLGPLPWRRIIRPRLLRLRRAAERHRMRAF